MKKKTIILLLLLLVGICAISTASAADDVDVLAVDDAADDDAITTDNSNVEEISTELDDNGENALEQTSDGENLAVSDDDSTLSKDSSDETLLGLSSSDYTIDLNESYTISSASNQKFSYYMKTSDYSPYYHFYMRVVDLNGNIVYNNEYNGVNSKAEARTYNPTFHTTFAPGIYILGAVNHDDNNVMDTAILMVTGNAVITASDYKSYYNSGAKMTATMTDQDRNPITSGYITVKFVNTKTGKTVTKTYKTDSNGKVSFEPPVGVGTWKVTYSSGLSYVTATAVQKTATITKAAVKIKAYKATEYKGFKLKLKAKVTSNGKKVNEGKVTFKINGKTYKVAVKNGFATKKIKLSKVKTYKYTARFKGSNFKTSKKVKAKAVLKKRVATKIVFKNRSIYTGVTKKVSIKVLTKSGKKVKNGKIKIVSNGETSYSPVKNGKVVVYIYGLNLMKHFKGFTSKGETYKKSITKKVKLKYIPAVHKYKASKKTVKLTSKFKCLCGKTSTHYHYTHGYYYTYKYKISVV